MLRFNDARRFGLLDYAATAAALQHIRGSPSSAPSPWATASAARCWRARSPARRRAIKAALLDQRVVAGLGNIYVCESLYWARLSPRRRAGTVAGERAERLAAAIRSVLERAIAAGGSSLRDYVQASGELGYFQHHWAVYGKEGEPCPGCDCGRGHPPHRPGRPLDILLCQAAALRINSVMLRRHVRFVLPLLLLAAPAAAASFVAGTEDVPLMPGLVSGRRQRSRLRQARRTHRRGPGARHARPRRACTTSTPPRCRSSAGARPAPIVWRRDGETLRLDYRGRDGDLTVGFTLSPQQEPDQ